LSERLEKNGIHAGMTFSNNLQSTSPGFVDAARNDFHLNTGSAAINAGTNVGIQLKDAAPDIGAYEFPEQAGDIASPLAPFGLRIH
jgi:hypothetical protein